MKKRSQYYITGFSGVGKSILAKALAESLNSTHCDLDRYIEEKYKTTIDTIFKKHGEKTFRKYETDALMEVEANIIATGGGIVTQNINIEYMKANGHIILLVATPEVLEQRLRNSYARPLLNSWSTAVRLMHKRAYGYINADYIIDTTALSHIQILDNALKFIKNPHK